MHYPDLKQCLTSEDLHDVITSCADALRIPLVLPAWPGQWAVTASRLRWASCDREGLEAENYLLLANLLMDGEVRHAEIRRLERIAHDTRTHDALIFLRGWIEGMNDHLKENPDATMLDALTSVSLCLQYARMYDDHLEAHYTAMRNALRLEQGLWCLEIEGAQVVALGSVLKSLSKATNPLEASDRLNASRI